MARSSTRSTNRTTTETTSTAQRKRQLRSETEAIEATGGSYQGTHSTIWLHNDDSDSDHAVMVSAHALPDYPESALNGCSCEDYTFRKPDGGCKHMRAIQKVVRIVATLVSDDHVDTEAIVAMMNVPESAARAIVSACEAE